MHDYMRRAQRQTRYVVAGVVAGTMAVQAGGGGPVVIEDFESYNVANGAFLDPTTVPFSGWTRNDKGVGPDWEVTCCSPGIAVPDETFDGSSKHMRLRRDDDRGNRKALLHTDLEFAPMSQGSVTFQLNPSERDYQSTETIIFHASLVDSVTGLPLVRVQYHEKFGDNNGQFEVFSFTSTAGSGTSFPFSSVPSGTDNLDRWYEVTMTILSNGFWNLRIVDIGATSPDSISEPFARDLIWDSGSLGTPITVVDTFRLNLFSGNGSYNGSKGTGTSNTNQPTMIDNITQEIIVAAPPALVAGVQTNEAVKISYPTDSGEIYQAQFSDDLSSIPDDGWEDLGIEIQGNGGSNFSGSAFAGVPDRAFRVLDTTFAAREVFDDFNDDSIDLLKWETFTGHTLLNDSVDETNMMILLGEGGTLLTQASLDPNSPGGVTASGKIKLLNINERLFFYFFGGSLGQQDNQRHGGLRWQIFGNSGPNPSGVVLDEVRLKNHTSGVVTWGEEINTLRDIVAGTTVLEFSMFAEGTNSTFEIRPATNDTSGASGEMVGSATVEGPLTWDHSERFVMFQNNGAGNAFMEMDDILVRSGVPGFIGEITNVKGPVDGAEISFPSEIAKTYEPQYSDDGGTTWFALGPRLRGNGGTISAIDAVTPGRIYQVLDLRP